MYNDRNVFKPAFSHGWIFTLGFSLLFFRLGWVVFNCLTILKGWHYYLGMFLTLANTMAGVLFLAYTFVFPSMRYIMEEECIRLKCGWVKKAVPYEDIKNYAVKDIRMALIAQPLLKLPGYVLGKTFYLEEGYVYMMGTRINNQVLILYLKNGEKIGLTPERTDRFIEVLRLRGIDDYRLYGYGPGENRGAL